MVEMHQPVMEKEVLHYLNCSKGGVFVDATLGDGGHAAAILENMSENSLLIGIDWDEEALARAQKRLKEYEKSTILVHSSYTNIKQVLEEKGYPKVNGILIDLGASTLQLMDPKRGFSYHHEGDLDMRMDRRRSLTAEKIINEYTVEDLTEVFYAYGEERWSKRIAARIVAEREKSGPIKNSKQLAELVKEAIPARYRRTGGHPSRKVFQALRLAVNTELDNIKEFLPQALDSLHTGGRLCVIAYHSLEDRLVKRFFIEQSGRCGCPTNMPCICEKHAIIKILTPGAKKPSEAEIAKNHRARSARLRAVESL